MADADRPCECIIRVVGMATFHRLAELSFGVRRTWPRGGFGRPLYRVGPQAAGARAGRPEVATDAARRRGRCGPSRHRAMQRNRVTPPPPQACRFGRRRGRVPLGRLHRETGWGGRKPLRPRPTRSPRPCPQQCDQAAHTSSPGPPARGLASRVTMRSAGVTPLGSAFTRRNRLIVPAPAGCAPVASRDSSDRVSEVGGRAPAAADLHVAAEADRRRLDRRHAR
jgi:hypothetical protein